MKEENNLKNLVLAKYTNISKTMKISTLFLFLFTLTIAAESSYSQNKEFAITLNNTSILSAIRKIEQVSDYVFIYNDDVGKKLRKKTTLAIQSDNIDDFLNKLLVSTDLDYKIKDRQVTIFDRKKPKTENKLIASNVSFTNSAIQPAAKLITGKVIDNKGEPVIGAAVVDTKNASNGTITDVDGNFSLHVAPTSVIRISSLGYVEQEISVNGRNTFQITLQEKPQALEEVVVVGYGTQKRITATGAVGMIEGDNLVQSPVANISNSMVGRVPGLFAMQTSGEPGYDQSKILIRGIGTFTGTSDPLVMVDGIESVNYNSIDPNDIESVSILKDASSTAVYGMRGANGVILITTKRGKIGPPQITYTFNQGFNSFTDLREGMTSPEFARNYNQAQMADQYITSRYTPLKFSPLDIELYANGSDPIFHSDVNWVDKMFRKNAPQSQHNMTLSGGQEKVRYFISAGYFNQEGMFKDFSHINKDYNPESIYNRINARSNFNFDVTDKFKILLDISSQTEIRKGNNYFEGGTSMLIGQIMRAAPIDGPGEYEGKIVNLPWGRYNNPVLDYLFPLNSGGVRKNYSNFLNGNLRLDYDLDVITKGLSVHGSAAYQAYYNQNTVNTKNIPVYTVFPLEDGSLNFRPENSESAFTYNNTSSYDRRITTQFGLDYKRYFGDHYITSLVIYKQSKLHSSTIQYLIPKSYQDLVGRVTYDYKNKYMFEFDMGYNGSENFAQDKRFGFFPAISLGWVPSLESFFPKNNIITFLKFRATYGEVGNDNFGDYSRFLFRPTSYNTYWDIYYFGIPGSSYGGYPGVIEGSTGNPHVTWERAVKKNLGIETRFFKDKLDITIDIWNELRDNIISAPNTISSISGIIQPPTNLGKMENKGYEGIITYTDKAGDFTYKISGNYSFARNKILFMDEITHDHAYQYNTGKRLGQPFALIVDGIFNTWEEVNDASRPVYELASNRIQPGDFKYVDVNGDGIINGFDAAPIGHPRLPEINFGTSIYVQYKGFDLSVLFQGASNTSYYYTPYQRAAGFGHEPFQGSARYLNESWTPERYEQGLPIKFPRFALATNPNLGSFYLADASYLRLKNMEIGYTFSNKLLSKIRIKSLRIYTNANNLITWSNMLPGVDPEAIDTGSYVSENYPLVRTVNLGFNVRF